MLLFLFYMLSMTGCAEEPETIVLTIEGKEFRVEVARTREERAKGLMHRESMDPDAGMLFVFPYDQKLSFWMKNTSIPLTVAYIGNDGIIKELHDLTPFSEEPVPSMRSARYALELNRGAYKSAGIEVGHHVEGLPDK